MEVWKPLFKLNLTIARFRPAESTGAIEAEILQTANQLYEARRDRLAAAASGIPNVIWAVTLLGGALTVAFSFFFGVPNFRLHLAMTAMLSASLALVIVLIVPLDYPFRWPLNVCSHIYERLFEKVVPAMTIDLAHVRSGESEYRAITDSMLT